MLILCIADVERDVGMKNLSPKEAITILEGMRIDIPVPKAAVTQIKRNLALDMAINALNCSEIPNNSDTISRQAVKDIFTELYGISAIGSVFDKYEWADICETTANELPSAKPDIIRCKDCKHWNPQLKTANGNGLGSCDFHNVALVTSEGFCYWAEKRGEG